MSVGSEVQARPFPKVTTGVATLVSDCLLLQYNWRLLRRYRLRAHRCLPSLFEAKRLVLCLVWPVSYFLPIRLDKHKLSCGFPSWGHGAWRCISIRHPTMPSPMRTVQYVAKWPRPVPGPPQRARGTGKGNQFGPYPVVGSCGDAVPWPSSVGQTVQQGLFPPG